MKAFIFTILLFTAQLCSAQQNDFLFGVSLNSKLNIFTQNYGLRPLINTSFQVSYLLVRNNSKFNLQTNFSLMLDNAIYKTEDRAFDGNLSINSLILNPQLNIRTANESVFYSFGIGVAYTKSNWVDFNINTAYYHDSLSSFSTKNSFMVKQNINTFVPQVNFGITKIIHKYASFELSIKQPIKEYFKNSVLLKYPTLNSFEYKKLTYIPTYIGLTLHFNLSNIF